MPVIRISTQIRAVPQRCFDLARDVDLHIRSTKGTQEIAVAGVTSGLIGAGESVTWQATHFGIRQRLTSQITEFDPPHHFRDSQVAGAFKSFDHDHYFISESGCTWMRDIFAYRAPLGILGRLADILFLEAYMRELLQQRAEVIRQAAEGVD